MPAVRAPRSAKEDAGAAEELVLLQRWGLTRASVLVDVGAGIGQFVLAASSTGARVVAVDVSPLMLDVLCRKAVALTWMRRILRSAGVLRLSDAVYNFPAAKPRRFRQPCPR